MRKKRTSRPLARSLRAGAAALMAALAAWILWLVGDPSAALEQLWALAGDARVSITLLSAELGLVDDAGNGLSRWDRLVLAQSSLLGGTLPSPEPAPTDPPVEESLDIAELDPTGEDEGTDPPASTTAPDGIIPKTMVAGSSTNYITSGNVSVYNRTDYTVDIPALLENAPQLSAAGEGPKVLIYHSHATESYEMDGTDIYDPSGDHRTLDTNYNMIRVGEEMKAVFEAAGIGVVHDTTLYDYPSYNDAYNRSVQGVAANLEKYPSLVLLLDVHRDALVATDGTIYKAVAGTVDNCAQVMMVMGSDATGQTHPNWKVNLALALSIQSALCDKWATLARPLVLRPTRFNQHLSTGTILVEVGTHGNTLQEAITAARLYARTVVELMEQEESAG
ncbi:MAG: stage II sporulation protein P [Clostridiales bacterium]|nr:stage II sporulation protein P [Clostridiales bacterium]